MKSNEFSKDLSAALALALAARELLARARKASKKNKNKLIISAAKAASARFKRSLVALKSLEQSADSGEKMPSGHHYNAAFDAVFDEFCASGQLEFALCVVDDICDVDFIGQIQRNLQLRIFYTDLLLENASIHPPQVNADEKRTRPFVRQKSQANTSPPAQ